MSPGALKDSDGPGILKDRLLKYGNYCACYRYGEFKNLNKEFWLEEMIRNSRDICGEDVSDEQCRAWLNCRLVMNRALKSLPEPFKEMFLVFEYLLPNHRPGTKKSLTEKGVRPDVLMIGKNVVTVFEFKQRKADRDGTVFEGYISQAEKYVIRLYRYHDVSKDMFVFPVLVMVLERNLYEERDDIIVCSPDRLTEALAQLNGEDPEPMSDREMLSWLESSVSV